MKISLNIENKKKTLILKGITQDTNSTQIANKINKLAKKDQISIIVNSQS